MPKPPASGVTTEGIRDLQRDLRAIDRKLPRELNKGMREGVSEAVLPTARRLAPVRSGRLRDSLRVGGTGARLYIRSTLPYFGPIHWGWPARNIRANPFVTQAIEERLDDVVEAMGDAAEDLARHHGFRHR